MLMKGLLLLGSLCVLLPISSFSQRSRKPKGPTISVSTSINYYPALEPYSSFNNYFVEGDDIILTYLTANSGTFVVEEGDLFYIERTSTNSIPTQLLSLGASVQVKTESLLFHEVSLTKLSVTKTSNEIKYATLDSLGKTRLLFRQGFEHKASAFGLRYELGKYFGKRKSAKVRFGLSAGLEPSLYFYKRTSNSFQEYPVSIKLFTVELSLNPMLSFMLSKKVSLDVKVVPNLLLGDFGGATEDNPNFSNKQKKLSREYRSPDIDVAFSAVLRYNIKEPKK